MLGDVIMTAGEGTEPLLSALNGQRPQMQLRPLAMGVCKLAQPIPRVFGHQFGGGSKPKLSVSTHEFAGAQYLYLGGQLAEDGVNLDDDNLRHRAVCAVSEALRWLEPTIETTRIFRVNRAEPSTNEGNRPDTAFVTKCNNLIVAWPTKLALAPALADQILPMLEINPSSSRQPQWPKAPRNLPMGMIRRQLGRTGLELSPIGLGTVKIGRNTDLKYPSGFELPTDQEVIELLEASIATRYQLSRYSAGIWQSRKTARCTITRGA